MFHGFVLNLLTLIYSQIILMVFDNCYWVPYEKYGRIAKISCLRRGSNSGVLSSPNRPQCLLIFFTKYTHTCIFNRYKIAYVHAEIY